MTKGKDLFRSPAALATPWDRTKSEAHQIIDEATEKRRALTETLKAARLARDAENPVSEQKPKKSRKTEKPALD
ncbi:hypothetical protein [Paracoccus ravus]|uniref:hypothetical protein n=1 Tax=Paracoccus ravus TaxID=2447760 RepID=UPI00106EB30F|nr:hypothetical protein [Paracoccus ravus]